METLPFANDWYLGLEFLYFKKYFDIKTVIETGTWKGNTTYWLSMLFDKIITIEKNEEFFKEASWLDDFKCISRLQGDSAEILSTILPILKPEPILLFLDAHSFGNGCPLLRELDALIKHQYDNSIIIVHDCFNPNFPDFNFDTYDGVPISFDFLKEKLDDLYGIGEYKHYFNTRASGEKVGVLFVEPYNGIETV